MISHNNQNRTPLHQPRIAEMIADLLREQILSGVLKEGDTLPRQEDMLRQFGVSKPSLREAMRMLEAEGLITVRRGNLGGAIVHVPTARNAAYMIGMVLNAQGVQLSDVGEALSRLEPLCATLCAARADRKEAVLPRLRERHQQTIASIDEALEFTKRARQFHEELVACCGNKTLILVVGALESLWSGEEQGWAERATETGGFPAREQRKEGIHAHERLLELIEQGDQAAVVQAATRHLHATQRYALSGDSERNVWSRPRWPT